MAMMAASLTAEHRAAISAGVRQSYALDPDGPAKKRAARAKWTWTPEASRALSETRKRMIADGTLAAPPASLGGRARAAQTKALYDGDCMSPESRASQAETQRRQFASGERTIPARQRAAVADANRRRGVEIAEMNRRRVWTPEMKAKRAATMLARYGALNKPATAETRAKIGAANLGKRRSRPSPLKGRPRSAETKAKISATLMGHAGHPMGAEALERTRRRMLAANHFKGKKHDVETRRRMSGAVKAAYVRDPSLATASGERIKITQPHKARRPGWRGRSSEANKRWASDPINNTRRACAARAAACQRPNLLEAEVLAFLDHHFPLEWRYNIADLAVGGKIPDFIRKDGQRVCIDVFGDFWHRGQSAKPRQALFLAHGYGLVIIWEREFRADPNMLTRRVVAAMTGLQLKQNSIMCGVNS